MLTRAHQAAIEKAVHRALATAGMPSGRWMSAEKFKAHTGKTDRQLQDFRRDYPHLVQSIGEPIPCGTNADGTTRYRFAEYRYDVQGYEALWKTLVS